MSNTELVHWGIKGQKWGVRRYQNPDGSLTPAGRKRYLNDDGTLNAAGKRRLKKVEKEEAKKEEDRRTHEEKKQDALQKGNATDILKFKGELTNQEMQTALTRISLERQLSDISAREIAAGQQKTKSALELASDVMTNVDKVRGMVEKGISAYNTVAKINNSLSDDEWDIIGDKTKKTRLEEKAEKEKKKAREKELREMTKAEALEKFNELSLDEIKTLDSRFSKQDSWSGKTKDGKGLSEDKAKELFEEWYKELNKDK